MQYLFELIEGRQLFDMAKQTHAEQAGELLQGLADPGRLMAADNHAMQPPLLRGMLQKLQPIHAGHGQVAQYDIHPVNAFQEGQGFSGMRRLDHRMPQPFELAHDDGALKGVLLKDQDA